MLETWNMSQWPAHIRVDTMRIVWRGISNVLAVQGDFLIFQVNIWWRVRLNTIIKLWAIERAARKRARKYHFIYTSETFVIIYVHLWPSSRPLDLLQICLLFLVNPGNRRNKTCGVLGKLTHVPHIHIYASCPQLFFLPPATTPQ